MKSIYSKRMQTKVVRTEHIIRLWRGMSSAGLVDALRANVPGRLEIREINEDEEGFYLVFLEEKEG